MCQKPCKQVFQRKLVPASNPAEPKASYRGGFSLLELLLVLAIIITLAAIATPRYQTALVRYRADLAARRIVADLALAQSAAKAGSSSKNVEFYLSSDKYKLFQIRALDGDANDCEVDLSERPYEADITSADFGGDQKVVFNGWGNPDSGGTVVVTVGPEQRTVTVDAETGEAQIQ